MRTRDFTEEGIRPRSGCVKISAKRKPVRGKIYLAPIQAQATVVYSDQNSSSFAFTNMSERTTTAGDIEPLWGAPLITGDTLIFTPSAFTSTSGGGSVDQMWRL